MGSYAHLGLGRLSLDENKWGWIPEYSGLFQPKDLVVYERRTEDDEPIEWAVLKRPLGAMLTRLELLGFTIVNVHKHIEDVLAPCRESLFEDEHPSAGIMAMSPIEIASAVAKVNADDERDEANDGLQYYIRHTMANAIAASFSELSSRETSDIAEGLSIFAILRLLAENPANLDLEVIWDVGEIVASGYVEPEYFARELRAEQRFLLATEGKSDIAILKRALTLRRPDIADFFYFVDVSEGYPFLGTGNLYNFCAGLSAIGVLNRIIIVYDNDAAGIERFTKALQMLSLPANIAVMHLPNLTSGHLLTCLGPEGQVTSDVNGRAASIECYLDFRQVGREPVIRWTNFIEATDSYQGALVAKKDYTESFLRFSHSGDEYDFTKLDLCLSSIIQHAIEMSETMLERFNPVLSEIE